jgi:hypothetical protein
MKTADMIGYFNQAIPGKYLIYLPIRLPLRGVSFLCLTGNSVFVILRLAQTASYL